MLKPNPQALFQTLGDESVILHLESEEYFGLDSVGSRIWEILSETGNVNDVVQILIKEFKVDEETLKADVEELVNELKKENLLLDV